MFHVISACSISRYKTIQLNVLLLNQFQLLTLNCFIIISCCYDIFNILSSATVLFTAIVRMDIGIIIVDDGNDMYETT